MAAAHAGASSSTLPSAGELISITGINRCGATATCVAALAGYLTCDWAPGHDPENLHHDPAEGIWNEPVLLRTVRNAA
jgi:hypothetical protein